MYTYIHIYIYVFLYIGFRGPAGVCRGILGDVKFTPVKTKNRGRS